MDDKTLKRHRDNVRRMRQERRRTPEWYAKRRDTLARAWSRFHPHERSEKSSSFSDKSDGIKRDKETDGVVE